ncbi:MAG: 23S rRNA (adenine(2503)-C(2))-methyltransferase RlmN [Peptococcaceae bacterium]|nr:23S rRNA (adenine(2503)-C(2))-methyltransferase RlmN [Peptococcaceae bacterium]
MNIYGLTYAQLENYLTSIGEKKSKAPFIFQSLYRTQVTSLMDVSEINQRLKTQLADTFTVTLPQLVDKTDGTDTVKFLFALQGEPETQQEYLIEAVLMKQNYGNSLCISTQAGCNMGCAFCQSGRFKKVHNLTTAELVSQIIAVQKLADCTIQNIVLMGIGEPFDNYDNVMQFLEIIMHPHGLALGKNHITVSTCGIVPGIEAYTAHPCHGLLAISLHAPDNDTRSRLMPINRRYPVEQLMKTARQYIYATGKKVMLEYVMLENINDTPEQAQLLADLIGVDKFHVNLIPYNATENSGFTQSSRERIMAFYDVLKKNNITVTMRREFGASVKAACGQLRADYENKTLLPKECNSL